MREPARRFWFDHPISMGDAQRVIEAALDDEGLHLSIPHVGGERLRLIRQGPFDLVIVPESRIGTGRKENHP